MPLETPSADPDEYEDPYTYSRPQFDPIACCNCEDLDRGKSMCLVCRNYFCEECWTDHRCEKLKP